MRLPPEKIDTQEQLAEFDQWLTARLERIKDSEKFTSEINSLCSCIQLIAPFLDNFANHNTCQIENLCGAIIYASDQFFKGNDFYEDEARIATFYDSFFNLLFLTTGATDNNLKNHFLIKLKEDEVEPLIPKRGSGRKTIKFLLSTISSTTKSEAVARLLAGCYVGSRVEYSKVVKTEPVFDLQAYLAIFLKAYIGLILEDSEEVLQFWAICHSYMELKKQSQDIDLGRHLLNACTIFKVRGSVSASGGHITEDILREKLQVIGPRAYDFIIPYKIDGWEPKTKLFIQSQFYAGDSGSVSHKVVDQTQSSRQFTLKQYPNARFVEYLDGAGYYAALRGDLEHMLTFSDTASFFQVKSALVRLRREFQIIAYVTPIELEHVVLTTGNCTRENIFNALLADGYSEEEIQRAQDVSIGLGYLSVEEEIIRIAEERLPIARRLLILDIAASNARKITNQEKNTQKFLLIPGYGSNIGILESELSKTVCETAKAIHLTPFDFASDIEWLLDEGVMKRR